MSFSLPWILLILLLVWLIARLLGPAVLRAFYRWRTPAPEHPQEDTQPLAPFTALPTEPVEPPGPINIPTELAPVEQPKPIEIPAELEPPEPLEIPTVPAPLEEVPSTPAAPVEAAVVIEEAPPPLITTKLTPRSPEQTLVLVADDSKVVRVKTSRLLAKHGYQVSLAEDGSEAARQMAQALPHVLITDVEMPGMDGFELSRHMRGLADSAHIPIIMVTSAQEKYADQAEKVGINVVLGKPYSDEELIAHVAASLQPHNEVQPNV